MIVKSTYLFLIIIIIYNQYRINVFFFNEINILYIINGIFTIAIINLITTILFETYFMYSHCRHHNTLLVNYFLFRCHRKSVRVRRMTTIIWCLYQYIKVLVVQLFKEYVLDNTTYIITQLLLIVIIHHTPSHYRLHNAFKL